MSFEIPAKYLLQNNMLESQWQNQVVQLAEMLGYIVYHTHDSRRSNAGLPDLLMWHPARPWRWIVAELKREGQKPTIDQQIWLWAFAALGAECYVWQPSDWDEVVEVLKGDK